jgi:hypothetical protein
MKKNSFIRINYCEAGPTYIPTIGDLALVLDPETRDYYLVYIESGQFRDPVYSRVSNVWTIRRIRHGGRLAAAESYNYQSFYQYQGTTYKLAPLTVINTKVRDRLRNKLRSQSGTGSGSDLGFFNRKEDQ